ncbi:MAG: hypothetical protein KDK70_18235, partial [Myxococcales bacterium]|nr:hypothetical protein [Myxococcales bacterium]
VALTALVGCGNFWTSNTVDLAAVEGAPVKISQVKMRHSRMIGLSSTPATFSSGDGPNAVGVEFSVDKVSQTQPHAGVAARLSCRVGDRVVVAPVAHDASDRLASLAAGASLTGSETFPPSPFAAQIPSICQADLLYMVRPPLAVRAIGSPEPDPDAPGPEANDVALGAVCLAGGTLREGPCTADELPRTPASARLEVSEVSAELVPHREGGFGVTATVLITTGAEAMRDWNVHGRVRCMGDDAAGARPLSMLAIGRGLAPGESIVGHGSTTPSQSWSSEPEACTLGFESAIDGERASLGEFCLRGGQTTAGACD